MSTEEGSAARFQTSRTAYWIDRTHRGPQDPLEALRALRHARSDINEAIALWVAAARRDGVSYGRIGATLEISRQAARQGHLRHQAYLDARHQRARYDRDLPPIKWRGGRLRWTWRRRQRAA